MWDGLLILFVLSQASGILGGIVVAAAARWWAIERIARLKSDWRAYWWGFGWTLAAAFCIGFVPGLFARLADVDVETWRKDQTLPMRLMTGLISGCLQIPFSLSVAMILAAYVERLWKQCRSHCREVSSRQLAGKA